MNDKRKVSIKVEIFLLLIAIDFKIKRNLQKKKNKFMEKKHQK